MHPWETHRSVSVWETGGSCCRFIAGSTTAWGRSARAGWPQGLLATLGATARLHTNRIEVLSLDLPIVIECVKEEKIQAILPELDTMIGGGLITLKRARVIMYRPARAGG